MTEINVAVSQLDQTTQQNAAMAEQNTAAAQVLRNETDAMTAEVGRFRLNAGPTDAPRERAA